MSQSLAAVVTTPLVYICNRIILVLFQNFPADTRLAGD